MGQALKRHSGLQMINAQEEHSLAEWQQRYPDLWLLIEVTEVTREEDGEPLNGRLMAMASEDVDIIEAWQPMTEQGKITAIIHGVYSEGGPTVVAQYV
jgi:hypothetical protein